MSTPTTEIFSKNLNELLIKRRKTQSDLSRYAKTTTATVSRWATGESMPRAAMFDKICAFLECSPSDLSQSDKDSKSSERTETHIDIIASEIWNRPILLKLFLAAVKASDKDVETCTKALSGKSNRRNNGKKKCI